MIYCEGNGFKQENVQIGQMLCNCPNRLKEQRDFCPRLGTAALITLLAACFMGYQTYLSVKDFKQVEEEAVSQKN